MTALSGDITLGDTAAARDIDVAADFALNILLLGSSGLFTISPGAVLYGMGGANLTANRMDLTGNVTAGSSRTVNVMPITAGRRIDLGSSVDTTPNTLELSEAELDRISSFGVVIGSTLAGPIHVSASISPAAATPLVLTTAGAVTQAVEIVVAGLAVTAGGPITLTHSNNDVSAFAAKAASGDIAYVDRNNFNVGWVSSVQGVDADGGSVSLTSLGGNVQVNNISANNEVEATGPISIHLTGLNGQLTIASSATLSSVGLHSYQADKINIEGAIYAAGSVLLKPASSGRGIDLGPTTDVSAGWLELSDAELGRISAGTLEIGDVNSGTIQVSSSLTQPGKNLALVTGGANDISFAAAGSIDAGGGNVTLTTGTGAGSGGIAVIPGSAIKVTANALSITSGAKGVAGFGPYLTTAVNSITASCSNSAIRLKELDNVSIASPGLNGGLLHLEGGTFQHSANNLIDDTATVDVSPAAALNLGEFSDTITGLIVYGTISGPAASVSTGSGVLTVGGGGIGYGYAGTGAVGASVSGNLSFGGAVREIQVSNGSAAADLMISAVITSGGIRKTGEGTLKLTAGNSYVGATRVDGGTLLVDGSLAAGSAVTVNIGAILGGRGTVNGPVTVTSGGTIAPGTSPGILGTGAVTFQSGSAFNVEIGGATPGNAAGDHDQLVVTGAVTIDQNATLNLLGVGGFTPEIGQTFTLVNNDGASPNDHTGEFAGLPEGAVIEDFLGSDLDAVISYHGGDGNDVTLTISGDNNAPGLIGASNFTGILDSQVNNVGNLVSNLIGGLTPDADQGALSGIAVTGLNTIAGSWEYRLSDGDGSWIPVGPVSSGAALLLRAEDRLRLVPIGLGNAM